VAEPTRKAMLMRWAVAFGHSLLCHVRCDAKLEDQLDGVLTSEVGSWWGRSICESPIECTSMHV
jgi:hypothetical protein